jgi:uncharacterized protein
MIAIGSKSQLRVSRKTDAGFILSDGHSDVLLPKKLAQPGTEVGQSVEVFVYTDSEDRPVATTQTPLAQVGDFACLRAVDQSAHGAFLDWGLDKDLFVPKAEQHQPMTVGNTYVVAVFLDNITNRVAAASKLGEFFDYEVSHLKKDEAVELLVYGYHDRGTGVIVNDRHSGLLYRDQTFADLKIGDRLKGYIDQVRRDNKLDVRLEQGPKRSGFDRVDQARETLLIALRKNDNVLNLGDKSTPEAIHAQLGISKKAFKEAIGGLYKSGNLELGPQEIRLTSEPSKVQRPTRPRPPEKAPLPNKVKTPHRVIPRRTPNSPAPGKK